MTTIEEKLKDLILTRYKSIREFILEIDMPYTTMDSMFKRGIGNSSIANVIKICKALGISADALGDGKIVPINSLNYVPENDSIEISNIIEDTKDLLNSRSVTLNGNPMTKTEIDSIINVIDVGIEIAKKTKKS